MSESAVEYYLAEHARRPSPAGLPWLYEHQRQAVESFGRQGFPTPRTEEWKYTDVSPITKRKFLVHREGAPKPAAAGLESVRLPGLDCHELVFINGYHAGHSGSGGTTPSGAIIRSLGEVLKQEPGLVEDYLNRYSNTDKNAFVAMNTAFIGEGAVVMIPDNVVLEEPVHLVFLNDNREQSYASIPRNLIVAGRNSSVTVIESYVGADDVEYFTNTNTEVMLEAGARLEHYRVQREGLKGFHVGNLQVCQHRDSRLESHAISLGGRLARNDIDVSLAGEGSSVFLNGLYMVGKRQHVDNHTRIDHRVPHTGSRENYRGILKGHARAVFNGKVVVHKDAQKTSADQSNANLLLSADAEVDTKPELEIYADDVQCSHGATTGQLDADMLFYLRSRGIHAELARSLLTFAFAEDVINHLGIKPLRDQLEYLVVGRLPDAEQIREFIE